MASTVPSSSGGRYYVPHHSPWPFVGAVSLFLLTCGAALWLNSVAAGPWVMLAGLVALLIMFLGWFGTVIRESESHLYNKLVDRSFRGGMFAFILSEIHFFAVFFGALLYVRQWVVPWLGGEGVRFTTNVTLWRGFETEWPTNGPGNWGGEFGTVEAFGIPALNTAILLLSSGTLTVAHHALQADRRTVMNWLLGITVALGVTFIALQVSEYAHAISELNLTFSSGIFGSLFYMMTGFHGLHVTVGVIMLFTVWCRTMRGHLSPTHHFAFEASAWYWHFVDVVWLGLFVFLYWL